MAIPRITVKNAGPGSLEILSRLWHAQWYASYTEASHHEYRMRTLTTPWAREHVQVFALEENGRVCSGTIVLSLDMVLAGKRRKVAGIAAVVTDPEQRGRGLAARLLQVVHRRLADAGHDAGLLFTEIGTGYYAKLGYIPWPLARSHLVVPAGAVSTKGYTFSPATAKDIATQSRLHRALQSRFEVRLARSVPYWRHMLGRARWKDEVLVPTEAKATRKHVPNRWIVSVKGKPVAYARVVRREADLTVTDAGYLPGHAGALTALIAHRCREEDRVSAAIVADASVIDELHLPVARREPIDKMMFAPLEGRLAAEDLAPAPVMLWPEDWF